MLTNSRLLSGKIDRKWVPRWVSYRSGNSTDNENPEMRWTNMLDGDFR
jgi:hypothetical protein